MKKYTRDILLPIVAESNCLSDVCRNLGMSLSGNNIRNIKTFLIRENIDFSHFYKNKRLYKNKTSNKIKNVNDVLIDDPSRIQRVEHRVLLRCLLHNNVKYECGDCKNNGSWNGQKMSLDIHHIDGNWKNNKIENLMFVCPNCHRVREVIKQSHYRKINNKICKCGRNKSKAYKSCYLCYMKYGRKCNRVKYPTVEEIKKLLETKTTTEIAKDYNCSSASISRFIKKNKINIIDIAYNPTDKPKKRSRIKWPSDNIIYNMLLENTVQEVAKQLNVKYATLISRINDKKINKPKNSHFKTKRGK